MDKKKYTGVIIGGIILLLTIWIISSFNGLVKKDEKVVLQWNEVQNAYQRRMDLIPNLVNVVKGATDFEQSTLVAVTEARAKAGSIQVSSTSPEAQAYLQQAAAQDELAAAANRLIIAVEKYPELKGAQAFLGLQTQLERTELRIKMARKDFNESIATYNQSVRSFPTKLVAGIFGFPAKEGFQSDAGADKAIEIKF
ncbi:MAG: LemA family protein [Ferruginibacter sp.]